MLHTMLGFWGGYKSDGRHHIDVPILYCYTGNIFLHEPATWNVLLGLVFATLGVVVLSLEAVNQSPRRSTVIRSRCNSITFQNREDINCEEEIALLIKYPKVYTS